MIAERYAPLVPATYRALTIPWRVPSWIRSFSAAPNCLASNSSMSAAPRRLRSRAGCSRTGKPHQTAGRALARNSGSLTSFLLADLENPGLIDDLDLGAEPDGQEPLLLTQLDAYPWGGVATYLDTHEPALLDRVPPVMADRCPFRKRCQVVKVLRRVACRWAISEGCGDRGCARQGGSKRAHWEGECDDDPSVRRPAADNPSSDLEHEASPLRQGSPARTSAIIDLPERSTLTFQGRLCSHKC